MKNMITALGCVFHAQITISDIPNGVDTGDVGQW